MKLQYNIKWLFYITEVKIYLKGVLKMTTEQRNLWYEGKQLWNEYIRLNGYNFTFNNKGIMKLSAILDLNQYYLKQRISLYLDN